MRVFERVLRDIARGIGGAALDERGELCYNDSDVSHDYLLGEVFRMDVKKEVGAPIPEEGVPGRVREVLSMDSIEAPVDILHRKAAMAADLPFVARSTGKYREGKGFSYFREGFDAYCLFLTVSGAGEVIYRGETKRIERGDMIFVSSGLPGHTRSLTDDWRFCFVNVAGSYCKLFEELWNEGGLTVIRPRVAAHYTELMERISDELRRADLLGDLNLNRLITELLTDALQEKYEDGEQRLRQTYPVWVQETVDILSDRCAEELRVSELAARFYMEQNSFTRRFKKYTGKTPKEYQMECRMERARHLIAESGMSLSEIAASCGFGSHSFFSKVFKQLYGVTPTEYRIDLSKKVH